LSTGSDDKTEAARQDDILKRTLAGESLTDSVAVEEQIEKAQRQWSAYEHAIEHLNREIEREKTVLGIAYSKTKKQLHDQLMVKLGKPALELHSALLEVYELRSHLIDNGIGLRGLCLTLPEFLSTPNNPYSDLADWFRAMKKEGFISATPKELTI
jgi:hypothetical protein